MPAAWPDDAAPEAAAAILAAGVCDGPEPGLNALVAATGLADHHAHGLMAGSVDEPALRLLLLETDRAVAAEVAGADTQTWLAIRRWCAPLLGLERHAPAEAYLEARLALGAAAVAERLVPAAGLSWIGVDTGYQAGLVTPPDVLGAIAGGVPVNRVVRLEAVAEALVGRLDDPWSWPDAFRAALADELGSADPPVAWKTVLAYRGGFDRDLWRPDDESVSAAAARWASAVHGGSPARLADDVLLRFGIWTALDSGLPLQVHTGFGDPDLDLHRSDPLLLTDLIRATEERAPIVLLHTYPFQRHAGYLARVFPHVHLDVGLAVNHAGAASEAIVREVLELAPFTKVLYSSDAWGAPELYLLGSWLFRRALSRVLGAWVRDGDWSAGDAERVVGLLARDNARRVYGGAG